MRPIDVYLVVILSLLTVFNDQTTGKQVVGYLPEQAQISPAAAAAAAAMAALDRAGEGRAARHGEGSSALPGFPGMPAMSGSDIGNAAGGSKHGMNGLMSYPGMASYLNKFTGNVVYQPHDSVEENHERAVYDPGDELLKALNAEMAANGQELGTSPEEPDYADTVYHELGIANKFDALRKLENELREEQEIVDKSTILMKMLEDPAIDTLPIVYVEDNGTNEQTNNEMLTPAPGLAKRSRYYRRYPWKRHNRNRSNYEPELRYACTPTKEDVFKLLVNLHENRKGNHSKTINFCNRKRPAKAIFTNIRFLG